MLVCLSQWWFQLLLVPLRRGYASGSLLKEDFRWLKEYLNEEDSEGPAQKSLGENTDVCTPSFSTPTGHLSEPFGSLVLGSLLGCLTPFQFLKNLDAQWLTLSTMAKRLLNFMKVFLIIRMTSWLYLPPGSHIKGWDSSSQCWICLALILTLKSQTAGILGT